MKILLSRPLNETPMLIPNIGLGYLATACRNAGHEVQVLDCIKEGVDAGRFREFLLGQSFDLVGFQVYTFDVPVLQAYLASTRSARPDTLLVAGGPHPTALPEETLHLFPMLDCVFSGEAETGLPVFLDWAATIGIGPARDSLTRGHDSDTELGLSGIAGLVRRLGDGMIRRNPSQVVKDLDATGFPAWDLISPETYPPAPQGTFTRRLPVAPIIVTRGCPFDCTFCGGHLVAGKRLRFRSAANVVDEMEFLRDRFHIREIHIEDDNFSLHGKLVREICQEMIRRNLDLTWACPNGLRIDSLDADLIRLMDQAGCYSIALGIESGSQRILDLMKKKLDLNTVRDTIDLIRRHSGIMITGFFMLGYPGETLEEMKTTIRYSLSLDIDKVNFGAFMPLPGTESWLHLQQQGLLDGLDLSRVTEYRVAISFGAVTPRRLRFLLQWAFFRFYFRPKIAIRFVREIHSFHQVKILGKRFLEVFWR